MKSFYFSSAQISEWALSLKYFRFVLGIVNLSRDGAWGESEDLTVALRVAAQNDMYLVLAHLGVAIERGYSENSDAKSKEGNSLEQLQPFPGFLIPRRARIAGAEIFIDADSRSLRLTLRALESGWRDSVDAPATPGEINAAAKIVELARRIETLLEALADKIIDPPRDDDRCVCPKYYPEIWGLSPPPKAERSDVRPPDPFLQLNEYADYRNCEICSRLGDYESGCRKVGGSDEDEFLPEIAGKLISVRTIGPYYDPAIRQCPKCTTCYLYRTEYEFLYGYGGSEDSQYLKRLTTQETLAQLKAALRRRNLPDAAKYQKEEFSKITFESVNINAADPFIVAIRYSQIEGGVDLGGVLRLEKANAGEFVDALLKCAYVYGQPEMRLERGADKLTIYESGHEQQPFYNVINRRDAAAAGGGLTGLMLTRWGAELVLSGLLSLTPNV